MPSFYYRGAEIVVLGKNPSLAKFFNSFATGFNNGGFTIYRVTRNSVERSLNAGGSSAAVLEALKQRSELPLPEMHL